jgi:hypothetical protein
MLDLFTLSGSYAGYGGLLCYLIFMKEAVSAQSVAVYMTARELASILLWS